MKCIVTLIAVLALPVILRSNVGLIIKP